MNTLANKYKIEKVLGQGGMGKVYLATDIRTKAKVAIKQMLIGNDKELIKRFKREYFFLTAIDHPNVIKALDFLEFSNNPLASSKQTEENCYLFLVAEYVSGISLHDFILQSLSRISLLERLAIASQITRAVEVINMAGILHRDIKPDNIMLQEKTQLIKLLDLGIARSLKSKLDKLTQTGSQVGTPAYMSPEQVNGTVSSSSDVFSLAIVLYQLFLNLEDSPFREGNYINTLNKICSYELPSIQDCIKTKSNIEQKIYQNLSKVISKALSKDPKERINATTLAKHLNALYAQLLSQQRPKTSKKQWHPTMTLDSKEIQKLAEMRKKYGADSALRGKTRYQAKAKQKNNQTFIIVSIICAIVAIVWYSGFKEKKELQKELSSLKKEMKKEQFKKEQFKKEQSKKEQSKKKPSFKKSPLIVSKKSQSSFSKKSQSSIKKAISQSSSSSLSSEKKEQREQKSKKELAALMADLKTKPGDVWYELLGFVKKYQNTSSATIAQKSIELFREQAKNGFIKICNDLKEVQKTKNIAQFIKLEDGIVNRPKIWEKLSQKETFLAPWFEKIIELYNQTKIQLEPEIAKDKELAKYRKWQNRWLKFLTSKMPTQMKKRAFGEINKKIKYFSAEKKRYKFFKEKLEKEIKPVSKELKDLRSFFLLLRRPLKKLGKRKKKISLSFYDGKFLKGHIAKVGKKHFRFINHDKKEHRLRIEHLKSSYVEKYLPKQSKKGKNLYYLGILFYYEGKTKMAQRYLKGYKSPLIPPKKQIKKANFPQKPKNWPASLWKLCWDDKKVDFSLAKWERLKTAEQILYAKSYQKWYAQKLGIKMFKKLFSSKPYEMVLIPPGRFWMGSNRGNPRNRPRHRVTISKAFWMGTKEVTMEQGFYWRQAPIPDHIKPYVARATWGPLDHKVIAGIEGMEKGFTFPTEAQWEYAARGGTTGPYYWGDKKDIDKYAWYEGNSKQTSHPPGLKLPNSWGLFDISGNVVEWCLDRSHDNYKGAPTDGSAWKNRVKKAYVIRGGSYKSNSWLCNSFARRFYLEGKANESVGFRLVQNFMP